jgi:hypothetical protein
MRRLNLKVEPKMTKKVNNIDVNKKEKTSFLTWLGRNLKIWVFTIKPVERIFGLIWGLASVVIIWSISQLYFFLTILSSLAIAYALYRREMSKD